MKQELKSLKHNGIYVPPYDYKGFSIKIKGHSIKLNSKTEEMAVAWVKKTQSTASPPDKTFYRNFIQDFMEKLKSENPSLGFLDSFLVEHLKNIDNGNIDPLNNNETSGQFGVDFSQVSSYLAQEKLKKENMTKTEKKSLTKKRKLAREELKEKFGYAYVNDRKIEIANWTAEPSCLFTGRGNHPRRGKWKEGPKEEDVILNLSPDSPKPPGKWKEIVWEPNKMYTAKWDDKLSGKIKYVWLSDSAFLKQNREKEKFRKAEKLGKIIPEIESYITKNLESKDEETRKIATVCWLIFKLNMRVGDEKDPGEADTVGAITLRPEHIKIENGNLQFDFLGKDSVRWITSLKAPPDMIRNIEHYSKNCTEYLFEGIDSKKASRFLSKKMKGLTAKVFRTWRTTNKVREYLKTCSAKLNDSEHVKLFHAKMANLKGAEVANHKRKPPANYDERIAKKETKLKELERQLKQKREEGKKTDAIAKRIEKTKLDTELMKKTKEWNLGTSLKSYIDPNVYVRWATQVDFSLEKLYSKSLRKKYSWALKNAA